MVSSPVDRLVIGDVVTLAPGQESVLSSANENTEVAVVVLTAQPVTTVRVSISALQEFENEFNAKADIAVDEARKNSALFKKETL
jgi:hypothetical protein